MKVEMNFILAQRDGLSKYDSERPCKFHGKVTRYTRNRGCVECAKEAAAKQYIGKVGKIRRITLDVHVEDVQQIKDIAEVLLSTRMGAANAQRRS